MALKEAKELSGGSAFRNAKFRAPGKPRFPKTAPSPPGTEELAACAEKGADKMVSAFLEAGADPALRDFGMAMEAFNSDLEPGEGPLEESDCVNAGGVYYADPPRTASEYARLLRRNSLAEKLESAERKWKAGAQSAKGGRKK
jgi:hypothetical protein